MTQDSDNQPEADRVDTDGAAESEASPSASGTGDTASTAEATPSSAPQTYVVQAGDSLSAISEKVYGDASHWKTIFEHNKDKIDDPDVIQPGQELVIP